MRGSFRRIVACIYLRSPALLGTSTPSKSADQCAFLEEISPLRILREFSRVARRTCRKFLEISSLPSSLTHTCPACLSILFHTGDINVLGNCMQLTSVDFRGCEKITGGCCSEERSFRSRSSPLFLWTSPLVQCRCLVLVSDWSTQCRAVAKWGQFATSALRVLDQNEAPQHTGGCSALALGPCGAPALRTRAVQAECRPNIPRYDLSL